MKLRTSGILVGIALLTGAVGGWKLLSAKASRADAARLESQWATMHAELARLSAQQDAAKKRVVAVEADTAWLRANMAKPPAKPAKQALSSQEAAKRIAAALAREGDAGQEETLRELLWAFDEGIQALDGTQKRRQRILLIARLGRLSQSYPPARAVLLERQEQLRKKYLEMGDLDDALSTFSSVSRALGDSKATLALFDALPADDARRRSASIYAYDGLVEARRYKEAIGGRSSVGNTADIQLNMAAGKGPEMIQSAVKNVLRDVEALAGTGEIERAQQLIGKVRALDDSGATRELMRYHLQRAGRLDLMP